MAEAAQRREAVAAGTGEVGADGASDVAGQIEAWAAGVSGAHGKKHRPAPPCTGGRW